MAGLGPVRCGYPRRRPRLLPVQYGEAGALIVLVVRFPRGPADCVSRVFKIYILAQKIAFPESYRKKIDDAHDHDDDSSSVHVY